MSEDVSGGQVTGERLPLGLDALTEGALEIARDAGRVILRHHGKPVAVEFKADDSPLTVADREAHERIVSRLAHLTPTIPVLSEESEDFHDAERESWALYWLVDPLDGSKEFLKRTGEFTVNLALVENGEPRLGVVHAPVLGQSYLGSREGPARIVTTSGKSRPIHVRRADPRHITVVASTDHAAPEEAEALVKLGSHDRKSMGSSLKFCLVAEGKADLYPRLRPTMEWDTAAAHCVLEAAGGEVRDLQGNPLAYNKADLRNPSFIAYGDRDHDWLGLFER